MPKGESSWGKKKTSTTEKKSSWGKGESSWGKNENFLIVVPKISLKKISKVSKTSKCKWRWKPHLGCK